ncbi:MCE family protein [Nocardioides caeni]|uniref:MCE family protein n=1 Tax=Nocardioides caeni TaxID=574700 RepID=A0A4S8NMR0_9ACTN|nr:MCE family protein [Nocardioides caeni]THV18230.1 MCE family protein [Nocardioides caeni]
MTTRNRILAGAIGLVVLAMAVSGVRLLGWLGGDDEDAMVVTAEFVDTTGVYVGNDVTYLGVTIGEIVEVEPHGTSMRVVMHLDESTQIPEEAAAEILQGSLVTDRFIELGPAYTDGPTLADGDHIDADHTRSPATVDEIAKAIDDLVVALDTGAEGSGRKGIGDALQSTARALEGNGPHLRRALAESQDALAMINTKDADLTAVTDNLLELTQALAQRDRTIRSFTRDAAATTAVLGDQRDELVAALEGLDDLTALADDFLRDNADVLTADLKGLNDVVGVVRAHQDSLAEAFDVMPTMAENFARAYDWDLGRLRVQFSFAVGPFAAAFRDHTCQVFAQALAGEAGSALCGLLFNSSGTGALDGILDGLYDAIPGGLP